METLIDASEEFGLEINVDKTKYMLLSRHQDHHWRLVVRMIFWLYKLYTKFCEFGIEPSGSLKCWETIEWPNI
jgi:hypothetical protein